jgi:Methyltransferase domain
VIPAASGPLLGTELLDHPDADPASVRESLRNIARSNRWFGGWWAVRHGLGQLLHGLPPGTSLSLLDVGAGLGDLPRAAVRWAARRGVTLRPLGLERNPTAARLTEAGGLPTVLACATALPIRRGGVDLIVASQLIHHLPAESILRFCREASRAARLGVVIADLRRSSAALAGFWVGSRLLRFDTATRADGLTSVRRGFTARELEAILARAGVRTPVVERPGFRLVAAWRTGAVV